MSSPAGGAVRNRAVTWMKLQISLPSCLCCSWTSCPYFYLYHNQYERNWFETSLPLPYSTEGKQYLPWRPASFVIYISTTCSTIYAPVSLWRREQEQPETDVSENTCRVKCRNWNGKLKVLRVRSEQQKPVLSETVTEKAYTNDKLAVNSLISTD